MVWERLVRMITMCSHWLWSVNTTSNHTEYITEHYHVTFTVQYIPQQSTNDHCELESYVDDSKVFMSFPVKNADQVEVKHENDLHQTATWCLQTQLLINPKNTKFLILGTRQLLKRVPDMCLNFLGESIIPKTTAKDLRIRLDSNLTYDQHISGLTSPCMSKLWQINQMKKLVNKETFFLSALVQSRLVYCSTIWPNISTKNIKKLEAV